MSGSGGRSHPIGNHGNGSKQPTGHEPKKAPGTGRRRKDETDGVKLVTTPEANAFTVYPYPQRNGAPGFVAQELARQEVSSTPQR